MKIIYCGYGRAAKECLLQLLSSSEFNLQKSDVLVYTHEGEANNEFIELLNHLLISYSFEPVNREEKSISLFKPDFLLSVYYRYIISDDILAIVKHKAINLHPSKLPDYKGCFSSVWAIINGEVETAATFHYISNEVDNGNILMQINFAIQKEDTAYSLYQKLVSVFIRYFNQAFKMLIDGDNGRKQDASLPCRYYKRAVPYNGILNSNNVKYEEAVRYVKAMYFPPFPSAKIEFGDNIVEFHSEEQMIPYKKYFK